jgi:hypothetical protein
MDGKKRVARLRNKARWKARFGESRPWTKQARLAAEARKRLGVEKVDINGAVLMANIAKVRNDLAIARIGRHKSPENKEGMIKVQHRRVGEIWVTKNPLKTPWGYIDWLRRKGFEELGSGAYSTVLGKPGSDRVVKVSRTLDNWIDYVQWAAKEGHAGKLAPRVYSWKRHEAVDRNDFSVAVVERMAEPARGTKSDEALLLNLRQYARYGNLLASVYMEDILPGSVKFFNELQKLDLDGDIGGNNVMIRKDGTLCVTDPTAGNIRTTVKRLRSGDLSPSALRYIGKLVESCYRYRSQCASQPN